ELRDDVADALGPVRPFGAGRGEERDDPPLAVLVLEGEWLLVPQRSDRADAVLAFVVVAGPRLGNRLVERQLDELDERVVLAEELLEDGVLRQEEVGTGVRVVADELAAGRTERNGEQPLSFFVELIVVERR